MGVVRMTAGVAIVLGAGLVSLNAPAGATSGPKRCVPAAMRVSVVQDVTSEGLGPFTVWLGWVQFRNAGATCSMPADGVPILAEGGSPRHHSPIGTTSFTRSPLASFTVRHGASAWASVRVEGPPPSDWSSNHHCSTSTITGLLVEGLNAAWPRHYLSIKNTRTICLGDVVTVSSSELQPRR